MREKNKSISFCYAKTNKKHLLELSNSKLWIVHSVKWSKKGCNQTRDVLINDMI